MIFGDSLKVFGEPLGEPNTKRRAKYHAVLGRKVPYNIFIIYFVTKSGYTINKR